MRARMHFYKYMCIFRSKRPGEEEKKKTAHKLKRCSIVHSRFSLALIIVVVVAFKHFFIFYLLRLSRVCYPLLATLNAFSQVELEEQGGGGR